MWPPACVWYFRRLRRCAAYVYISDIRPSPYIRRKRGKVHRDLSDAIGRNCEELQESEMRYTCLTRHPPEPEPSQLGRHNACLHAKRAAPRPDAAHARSCVRFKLWFFLYRHTHIQDPNLTWVASLNGYSVISKSDVVVTSQPSSVSGQPFRCGTHLTHPA